MSIGDVIGRLQYESKIWPNVIKISQRCYLWLKNLSSGMIVLGLKAKTSLVMTVWSKHTTNRPKFVTKRGFCLKTVFHSQFDFIYGYFFSHTSPLPR